MAIMTQTELIVRKICPLDTEGRQLRHNGNCFTEQTAHGHQINTACTISHQKDTLRPSYQTYGLYALQTSAVWLLMSRKCSWRLAGCKWKTACQRPFTICFAHYAIYGRLGAGSFGQKCRESENACWEEVEHNQHFSSKCSKWDFYISIFALGEAIARKKRNFMEMIS